MFKKLLKNKKILIIIGLLLLILASIVLLQGKNQTMPADNAQPIKDTFVEETLLDAYSEEDSGMTIDERSELDQVSKLKDISPVSTPDFSLEYSYKTGGFIVKSNKSLSVTEKNLEIWLNNNGFADISDDRFEYQSSKLAL